MPVTWKNKGALKRNALRKLERDMEDAAAQAADVFDKVVQSADRIETGEMNSLPVQFEVHETPKTIRASWGWSLADRRRLNDRMTQTRGNIVGYPDLQDHGFWHWISGNWIKGMMASKESRDRFMDVMRSKGY